MRGAVPRAAGPLLRAALRDVLADEIDHARVGWAYLASTEQDERMRLERRIPTRSSTARDLDG
jgi:hypothetical protein